MSYIQERLQQFYKSELQCFGYFLKRTHMIFLSNEARGQENFRLYFLFGKIGERLLGV